MTMVCQDICTPWAATSDVYAPYDSLDAGLLGECLDAASWILYVLTKYRWPGICQETLRPCRTARPCSAWPCSCVGLSEWVIPNQPVTQVTQVKLDGVVLDTAKYRLDNNRVLVYLPADGDERQVWPSCQRLDLADTEDDTWSVTYNWGATPPTAGKLAAAVLGGELALSRDASTASRCRLPQRITSLTRQGVTMAVADPQNTIGDGYTGIAEIDLFIAAANRGSANRPAAFVMPDLVATRGRRVP